MGAKIYLGEEGDDSKASMNVPGRMRGGGGEYIQNSR